MPPVLRILHLEDDPQDAKLIREILTEHDFECRITCVDNRKDFEDALEGESFDLIISDYKLPSFDGISALAIARNKNPDIPFIFVSGNIGEERAIEALKNGATDYILKGSLLRLVSSIKRALREVEMRKEHRELEERFRQSQKMEAIGRLAGGIAHDFNNMLTVILSYCDMLMQDAQSGDPVYTGLEEIRKAGEKSSALTRQLLAFSRRQVLQPRVTDLNALINSASSMFRRLIGEAVEIATEFAGDLGKVKVDPNQFEQVMLNLIVNARDAMPKGGRIVIRTGNVSLDEQEAFHHQDAKPGEYVVISVKDSGIGMTEEVKAHIFEPFFTTKGEGKGTGFGLATAFGIVRQSGGYIEVDSIPDKGTQFRIYLPRTEEKEEPLTENPVPAKQSGSETILLVEDEPVLSKLTRKILEMNGYTVMEAGNAEAALLTCRSHRDPIHLLLTDSVMPDMNGMALSEMVSPLRPGIKVLYMSGHLEDPLRSRKALVVDRNFLQKPFTPEALARKVREILDA